MRKLERKFVRGQLIHGAGENGGAWQIIDGSVRLDRPSTNGSMFAGLARSGDVIGVEALADGAYQFDAVALCNCTLRRWVRGSGKSSILQLLAAVERRGAETLALRCGDALARVRHLILMLADGRRDTIAIPLAKDMAEMTDLAEETVSRAFSALRRQGLLKKYGARFGLVHRPPLQAA